ncbi:ABC transporter permease [Metallumcola ferriviriculae]|uniref:ABC transporter permease n=1 Tax=Metallumcola ferriviriculae TaxID=3039180 RepID=A0AAU0UU47_9FIRM|nr:ABC transporter permease [Desulfitibacteraceae bacterium MK1]
MIPKTVQQKEGLADEAYSHPRWYLFTIKLKTSTQGLLNFIKKLKKHPSAMTGLVIILIFIGLALLAPQIVPHDPFSGKLADRLAAPSWLEGGKAEFFLGTDQQGRDLLSRIIYGARISLWVGFICVIISTTVGTLLGIVAGYFRGRFDTVLSRIADLLLAFPFLIFAVGVMAFLGPGLINLILALTFKGWVEFFRLVRGEMLSEKTKEYVEAARANGQSSLRVMFSEVLPNIIHTVVVLATLRMGFFIIMEASLSFLGLGIQPPQPAWGFMVSDGRDFMMNGWWLSTFPGLAILSLILSINLFGEGLRDILDPRLKIN